MERLKRWPPAATPLAVHERFGELGGGFLASAVTLTLFLSLFPILLVAVAVLGFASIADASFTGDVVERLGVTGDAARLVTEAFESAERSRVGSSVVGALGLVWTSLGLVSAVAHVCNRPWQLPSRGWKDKLVALGWLVGALVLLGTSIVLAGLLRVLPGWLAPVQVLAGVGLLVGFFLFTFRVLTSESMPLRTHLPGALAGGVGVQLLTLIGTLVVPRQVATASGIYGSIGVVFAILAWLLFFGRLLVYSVVLNVVLHERARGTDTAVVEVPHLDAPSPETADRSAVVHTG